MRQIELPDWLPLYDQDIEIMRCTTCGAIAPGTWGITREAMRAGIDHVLDRHSAALAAGDLRPPLFVNCPVLDPFWFDEHVAPATPEEGNR
ncbi:hypothetical protein AB0B89_23700 [Sphaerisporangium sp. NPDC049002]|uniref:hypothetical protein n=1 Tax=Sphaerisporangium sp. NPDC049002 TaxID=3155392 RepID=UPI00340D95BF